MVEGATLLPSGDRVYFSQDPCLLALQMLYRPVNTPANPGAVLGTGTSHIPLESLGLTAWKSVLDSLQEAKLSFIDLSSSFSSEWLMVGRYLRVNLVYLSWLGCVSASSRKFSRHIHEPRGSGSSPHLLYTAMTDTLLVSWCPFFSFSSARKVGGSCLGPPSRR